MKTLIYKPLSELELKKIEWLPLDRFKIPRGKITLLVGDPGNGKSFVLLDAIAELTKKHGLKAFILSEDDPHDTIKPRIEYMQGKQDSIGIITGTRSEQGKDGSFVLRTEYEPFKELVEKEKPDLIAFDPLVSYVGDVDMFKGAKVRQMLDPYVKLAAQHNFALIFVIHLNKADTKAVYKVADSIQTLAVAKCGYIVGPNPDATDIWDKVICHFKTNISQKTPSYTFCIEPNQQSPDMARVDWGNETNLKADDLVKSFDDRNGEKITKQDIAKSFLQGALFKGPQFSTELETEAVARDISCRTLDRAKESLGIESAQVKNDDGAKVWVSYFPQH